MTSRTKLRSPWRHQQGRTGIQQKLTRVQNSSLIQMRQVELYKSIVYIPASDASHRWTRPQTRRVTSTPFSRLTTEVPLPEGKIKTSPKKTMEKVSLPSVQRGIQIPFHFLTGAFRVISGHVECHFRRAWPACPI